MPAAKKAPVKKTASKTPVKKAPAKKATAAKTIKPADAPAWNTIHVFGYGESQIIGREANGKVPNDKLKAIAPLLTHLESKQQKGTKVRMDDLHALNIINGVFIDFQTRGEKNKGQRFAWSEIDGKAVSKLADELKSKVPEQTQTARGNIFDLMRKRPIAPKAIQSTTPKAKSKARK